MSSCSVSFGQETDGMCDFFESHIRTARKPHICLECRKEISIGQKYESLAYVFEQSFYHENRCMVCVEIRGAFLEEGSCYSPGDMWNEISDYVFPEMTTTCFDRLQTPEAKTVLQRRWNEWKFQA